MVGSNKPISLHTLLSHVHDYECRLRVTIVLEYLWHEALRVKDGIHEFESILLAHRLSKAMKCANGI